MVFVVYLATGLWLGMRDFSLPFSSVGDEYVQRYFTPTFLYVLARGSIGENESSTPKEKD